MKSRMVLCTNLDDGRGATDASRGAASGLDRDWMVAWIVFDKNI